MNKFVFLFLILVCLLLISGTFATIQESITNRRRDGFANCNLEVKNENATSDNDLLVKDIYPPIGSNSISKNTSSSIWWHKPVFELGSYEQITNNIRYSNNPDIGSCTPASMCGALYHENQIHSNYSKILPQINPNCGRRVGYFDTQQNMLPFRVDMQNILY